MSQNQVIIFDTTLRDGEQSPGASMTKDEKLRIARALEKLRVDVIEAGFAIASPGDFEAVKLIADTIQDSIICRPRFYVSLSFSDFSIYSLGSSQNFHMLIKRYA